MQRHGCAFADPAVGVPPVHPLEPVRSVLAAARRGGLDFDTAWAEALELAPAMWRATLEDTAGAWRAAYDRQGPHELADVVSLRRAARERDENQPR
ncbi:MAG TPA: hypothetical protein VFO31_19710, partial [Vicinamibacterales bacterium]|nr:hypothetical protein [Vicinamibacterales bacterium]